MPKKVVKHHGTMDIKLRGANQQYVHTYFKTIVQNLTQI